MAWGVPKIGASAETTVAGGNLTLAEPSGIAQGDLMVCCIAYRSNAAFTVPGDWDLVATQQSSGDTDATDGIASGVMMWCVRGSSAPTLTFNRTGGDVALGRIIAYSGVQRTSPYDTGSANTLAVSSVTATTGTFSTALANELIVAMAVAGDEPDTSSAFDAATDPTTPSGATDTTTAPTVGTWIERADSSTGTGADTALAIADAIRGTAGATGTIQCTHSAASRAVMIAGAWKIDVAPTISPNTADAASFSTGTPTLEATATDANADDVRYWLQIDSVNTFDSIGAAIDSYSESNQDTYFELRGNGATFAGQSFAGTGAVLRRAKFYLMKIGTPTGNATVELWSHTGTFGSTGTPNAILVAGESLDVSTLTGSFVLYTLLIPPTTVSGGTNYFIILKYQGGDSSNHVRVGYDNSAPGHGGNSAIFSVGSWSAQTGDLAFYVDATGPLLGKVSGTDSGFANTVTGGDTDPFNSGEKVSFTVQAGDALADGTWYWRARCNDPNGGNTYSSWTTARSFTISSTPPPSPGKKLFAALLAKRHFDLIPL
jgi:hypothetical protein